MSNASSPEELPAQQGPSPGSDVPTPASRTHDEPQPVSSDPSAASKRVCFYKSGDHKFGGHRMVVTGRTFKTFDALLDALSKKVPLPFGVRTVTTPRGTRQLKALEDLSDGGLYVCSDRRRVKPLNLDEVNRQQIPWDTTRSDGGAGRPAAGGRNNDGPSFGQSGRRKEFGTTANRIGRRIKERRAGVRTPKRQAGVRTPKRLVVINNREPTVKRTVVLQRRTAPTFDALLDYLSQIMQFSVLKLYSTDGRRVDGLAALILCSGIIVAAGSEPFRLGKHNHHRTGQVAQTSVNNSEAAEPNDMQPLTQKNKSSSSGRASRNFSLSSERHIVDQINKSLNGSADDSPQHHHNNNGSSETEGNPAQRHSSTDMDRSERFGGAENRRHAGGIVPEDDDIEKSFRVNPDGSMTVEMKVRLTIKEEEMLHWTTTLSRVSLSKTTVRASNKSGSGKKGLPGSSHSTASKDNPGISEDETKPENRDTSQTGTPKSSSRRNPTPGPRHVRKKASVESVKTVTESGVEASSTLGQYSYTERTADGELTEGYCVLTQSSSSRPVPKPRRKTTPAAGASNKGSRSSVRSPGTAEVLQIQSDEVTETVMHIYERQGCFDSYSANMEYNSSDSVFEHGSTPVPQNKPASCDSGQHSSSNDVDFTQPSSITDSLRRQKEEILSLSSDPKAPTPNISKKLSSLTDNVKEESALTVADSQNESLPKETVESVKKNNVVQGEKKSKTAKTTGKQVSPSVISSGKKQKESLARSSKSAGKTSESNINDHNVKRIESFKTRKKVGRFEITPVKKQPASRNVENPKGMSSKSQLNMMTQRTPRDKGQNVHTHESRTARLPTKKKSLVTKQKNKSEKRMLSPRQTLTESISLPTFNTTPSDPHQYVENWLQQIKPDAIPYLEDADTEQSSSPKVVFQIGGDSESEDKSECQEEHNCSHCDACITASPSISVPVCSIAPTTSTDVLNDRQTAVGVSMPTVTIEPVDSESQLRTLKSAEGIGPVEYDSSCSTSNRLSLKSKVEPVLQQVCSSIQSIRSATETDESSKSSNLPHFSSQVASVFGSSSKVFLSFLSVMTLRDTLAGSTSEDANSDSAVTSEAMLMLESLQRISTIEDEVEQRASLTDLQSRTSLKLREQWSDFQVSRERLESEPLSPRFSEFALDVSEEGNPFEDQHLVIDELMDELNMPQDLREEITSTLQHNRNFHPEVGESTILKRETHHSESGEEMEPNECDSEKSATGAEDMGREIKERTTKKEQGAIDGVVNESEEDRHEEGNHEEMEVSDREEKGGPEEDEEKEGDEDKEEGLVHVEEKGGNENYDQLDEEEEEEVEIRDDEEIEGEAAGGVKGLEEVAEEKEEEAEGEDTVGEDGQLEEAVVESDKEEGSEGARDDKVVVEGESGEEEIAEEGEVAMDKNTEEEEKEEEEEGEDEDVEESRGGEVEESGKEEEGNREEEEEEEGEAQAEEGGVEKQAEEEREHDEEEQHFSGAANERLLDEACYLQSRFQEHQENKNTNVDTEDTGNENEGDTRHGHGSDTMNKEQTDEGEGEGDEEASCNPPHPVEISQELLDFVNSALQSSSLIFTYDARGNIKIEQDKAQVVHTKRFLIPRSRSDNLYGLKRLPSPNTSDLSSDYRPETSDSGGYDKAQGSLDVFSESVENSESQSPNYAGARHISDKPNRRTNVEERTISKLSQGNISEIPTLKREGSSDSKLSQEHTSDRPILKSEGSSDSKLSQGNISERPTLKSGQSSNSKLSQEHTSDRPTLKSGQSSNSKSSQGNISEGPTLKSEGLSDSKLSEGNISERPRLKSGGSLSTYDSRTKSLGEDLSNDSSAASALKEPSKEHASASTEAGCSNDGVLIDHGRWLLKENHLIRNSPPITSGDQGMYGNADTTSMESCQETAGNEVDHSAKHRPLDAISSSELEDMAKPPTPKCAYYNMEHGSDSDPFLESDVSVKSRNGDARSSNKANKGASRVSPTIDTGKTWAKTNHSLSSFTSVEFKAADSRVHPEGESSSAVTQADRPSSVAGAVLQAQDSREARGCGGRYCPIL